MWLLPHSQSLWLWTYKRDHFDHLCLFNVSGWCATAMEKDKETKGSAVRTYAQFTAPICVSLRVHWQLLHLAQLERAGTDGPAML